jgi:uncharacterized protein (TIGR03067 family)
MRYFALAVVVCSGAAVGRGAPVPKEKAPANPDLAAMQGKWVLTDMTFNGISLGADFAKDLKLTMEIKGDTCVTEGQKFKQRITAEMVFDRDVTPHRLTYTNSKDTDLDGKPPKDRDPKPTSRVIYKIAGDTLTVGGTMDGTEFPKGFGEKGVMTMTFARVKK